MSINNYNLDEQIELITLAEYVIEFIEHHGSSETIIDRGHDSEDFFYMYKDIEKQVLKIRPEIFNQEDEEDDMVGI